MSGVVFDRKGQSGNIFFILGKAQQVLRIEGRMQDAVQMGIRVHNCHSYEEALEIISEYVDLIDMTEG